MAGAGLIGERHREEIDASSSAEVGAIVDPFPAATEVAAKFYVPLYSTLAELFEIDNPDGVIQATPKQMHVAASLESVAADVLLIVKKPIGDSVEAVTQLVHGRGVHHSSDSGSRSRSRPESPRFRPPSRGPGPRVAQRRRLTRWSSRTG